MATFPLEPPLPWLWSCHHCHARYPLGATRRCLHDGHYFCGGTTVSALTGKTTKRHRACGSEFDYIGWEDVSRWRRSLGGRTLDDRLKKRRGCDRDCEYPSACQHRRGSLAIRHSSRSGIEPLFNPPRVSTDDNTTTTNDNEVDFESFLDPSFFQTQPTPTAPKLVRTTDVLSSFPLPKSTRLTIGKLFKVTKRNNNSQPAILPSTPEKDLTKNTQLHPTRSPTARPLSSSPPSFFTIAATEPIGARASANELGLIIPTLDFDLSLSSLSSSSTSTSDQLPSLFSPDTSSSSSSSSSSEASSLSEKTPSESLSPADGEEYAEEPDSFTLAPHQKQKQKQSKIQRIDLSRSRSSPPPDIDMTDSIPESPTSPTSPVFPSLFTVSTDTGGKSRCLTPKSPDSPTNPLYLRDRVGLGLGLGLGLVAREGLKPLVTMAEDDEGGRGMDGVMDLAG